MELSASEPVPDSKEEDVEEAELCGTFLCHHHHLSSHHVGHCVQDMY